MKTIRDILFLSLFSVSVFYFWWDTDQTAITNSEVPMLIFNITFRSAFVTIVGVFVLNMLLKSFAYKDSKDSKDVKDLKQASKDEEDKEQDQQDEKGAEDIEIKLFIYSMIIASFASYFFTSLWIWTQCNRTTIHIKTLLVGQLFIFYLIFFLFLWT